MAATAFDTLQAARDIEAAGLERAQAEAIPNQPLPPQSQQAHAIFGLIWPF